MSHGLASAEGSTEVPEAGAEESERHHGANGTSPPDPPRRRAGRPKGSKNRATLDGRMFYGKHARKLVPKLIRRAWLVFGMSWPMGILDSIW